MFLKTTSVAAVALFAGMSVPAMAQSDNSNMNSGDCSVVNQQIEQQFANNPEQRAEYSGQMMRDLRELRDAAQTLQAYGKTEACQSIADAVHDITENPGDAKQSRMDQTGNQQSGNQQNAQTQQQASNSQQQNMNADQAQAQGQPTFQNATAIGEMDGQVRADNILGADLRSRDDEWIGEVDDLVLGNQGHPTYAVVTYGGFLGLGEEASAVPFEMIHVAQGDEVYYLPMSEEQLEDAPRFDQGNFEWTRDEQWRTQNDDYFNSLGNEQNAG
ncbi:PRC-barrel domain-containing protein [Amorphus orientalis]|uniref:PRC-barrel domain-containing protein n=1 Tax=Amorphus orientalis TaxID=649198 RepID=A0AAE4ARZ9_9HYPH|nr:PRC-barrel domain-containing protein [Amorphus orientalis]MDQ0313574.1 hypothetical protein [Amorphus orientalis]